jgi:putative glutamine amidotransferase
MRATPLILIIPSKVARGVELSEPAIQLAQSYSDAVVAAGGLPWVVPRFTADEVVAECVRRSDGCLLVGGDDIQPELYRRRLSPALRQTLVLADAERATQELLVIQEVFRQRKPLFAICRGVQMLNVAFGGTLYVDISSELPQALDHRCVGRSGELTHAVTIEEGSLLARIIGRTDWSVNSSHHQALRAVPDLLAVTARAPDGVIEALELAPAHRAALPFLLGLQCHPERVFARHPEFLKPFAAFVQVASARRKQRS